MIENLRSAILKVEIYTSNPVISYGNIVVLIYSFKVRCNIMSNINDQ